VTKVTMILFLIAGVSESAFCGGISDCVSAVVQMQREVDPKVQSKSAYEVAGVACSSGGTADRTVECLKGFTAKTKVGWLVAAHACSGGSDSTSALKCFERVKPNMGNSNEEAANLCSYGTDGDRAVECINKMAKNNFGWDLAQFACRGNNDGDETSKCLSSVWPTFGKNWHAITLAQNIEKTAPVPTRIKSFQCSSNFWNNREVHVELQKNDDPTRHYDVIISSGASTANGIVQVKPDFKPKDGGYFTEYFKERVVASGPSDARDKGPGSQVPHQPQLTDLGNLGSLGDHTPEPVAKIIRCLSNITTAQCEAISSKVSSAAGIAPTENRKP